MTQGKVWLVGAGPYDEGLFTIKGKRVLEQADVVVYDNLVGDGILGMIPSKAVCIDVGKQAGNHNVTQKEINEMLLYEAKKGKRVVRLKGGDPFLFGRGGEELELLCEHRIPFEIVPGIPSAIGVPAYAGIPVTHREFTSSLHIITGHKKRGCNDPIDYKSLVALGEVTLVFLMSVGAMPEIARGLMEAGMDPDMPAAMLEKGTSYRQRNVVATIATLPEEARKHQISTPGIFIVGKVCSLSERFAWAEKRPLGGRRVIITRPRRKASKLKEMLYDLGAEVVELPSIETVPIPENLFLQQRIRHIEQYQWILFTSEVAVELFFDTLYAQKVDIRTLAKIKLAVVGPATKKALENRGMFASFMPKEYYGEKMAEGLIAHIGEHEKVMVCVPREVDSELVKHLKLVEQQVDVVPVYDIVYEKNEKLVLEENDLVVFTSASTVKGFATTMVPLDYGTVHAICIGHMTGKEASRYGMKVTIAKEATIESLVECVMECSK